MAEPAEPVAVEVEILSRHGVLLLLKPVGLFRIEEFINFEPESKRRQ